MQSQPSQLISAPHHFLTYLPQSRIISPLLSLGDVLNESLENTEHASLKLNQLQSKPLYLLRHLLGMCKYMYGIGLQF